MAWHCKIHQKWIPKLGRELDSSCCSLCTCGKHRNRSRAGFGHSRSQHSSSGGLFLGCSPWVLGELNMECQGSAADLGKGQPGSGDQCLSPAFSHCKPAWGQCQASFGHQTPTPPTQGSALSSFHQSCWTHSFVQQILEIHKFFSLGSRQQWDLIRALKISLFISVSAGWKQEAEIGTCVHRALHRHGRRGLTSCAAQNGQNPPKCEGCTCLPSPHMEPGERLRMDTLL